jgi:hypothetical protein
VNTPEDGCIKAETCSVEKNYSTKRIIIIIIAARKDGLKAIYCIYL